MDTETPNQRFNQSIGIVAITRHGVDLALRLQAKLGEGICYVPERHGFALAMGASGFRHIGSLFSEIWPRHGSLVFIMATGIVVRGIAPLLRHKTKDPAIVVLDEKGQFVISLISGHLGGANRLAHKIAGLIGGQPVITTASDVRGKPSLDLVAQDAGLEIGNMAMLSRAARALLEDEPMWGYDPEERLKPYLAELKNITWLPAGYFSTTQSQNELEGEAWSSTDFNHLSDTLGIWVSERLPPTGLQRLALHPRTLVVGIGCNRGTSADEILNLIRSVFERERLSALSIRNLASVDLKAEEPGILEVAERLNRPVYFYSRSDIEHIQTPNPSVVVQTFIGVKSVCEATALMSAQSGKLIIPKQKTANATLAIARASSPS